MGGEVGGGLAGYRGGILRCPQRYLGPLADPRARGGVGVRAKLRSRLRAGDCLGTRDRYRRRALADRFPVVHAALQPDRGHHPAAEQPLLDTLCGDGSTGGRAIEKQIRGRLQRSRLRGWRTGSTAGRRALPSSTYPTLARTLGQPYGFRDSLSPFNLVEVWREGRQQPRPASPLLDEVPETKPLPCVERLCTRTIRLQSGVGSPSRGPRFSSKHSSGCRRTVRTRTASRSSLHRRATKKQGRLEQDRPPGGCRVCSAAISCLTYPLLRSETALDPPHRKG